MEKVNKKKQIEDLQTVVAAQWRQINKLKLHLGRLVDIDWSDEQANHDEVIAILDNKEPKPKQLDQSVFDGLDVKWRFAAVDSDGRAHRFTSKVEPHSNGEFMSNDLDCGFTYELIGTGYDTTNWQNSLIERDIAKELLEVDLSSELTGSELCRAMLARGDVCVPCFTSWDGDTEAIADKSIWLVHDFLPEEPNFHAGLEDFYFAVPINTRTGEPLTETDVGL